MTDPEEPPFATLEGAIGWTKKRWDDRAAPIVTHSHMPRRRGGGHGRVEADSRLGSPAVTPGFWRWIMSGIFDVRRDSLIQERCYHPQLGAFDRIVSCPDCGGSGHFDKRRDVYLYPMTAALTQLAKVPAMRPHQPAPCEVIMAVAMYGWDWRRAAAHLELPAEMFEALALLSFRKLEARYRVGPETRVGWVSMSESAQNAIIAGEEGAA